MRNKVTFDEDIRPCHPSFRQVDNGRLFRFVHPANDGNIYMKVAYAPGDSRAVLLNTGVAYTMGPDTPVKLVDFTVCIQNLSPIV